MPPSTLTNPAGTACMADNVCDRSTSLPGKLASCLIAFGSTTLPDICPFLISSCLKSLAKLISVLAGQVGTLLVMTDMQRSAMYILAGGAVIHLTLLVLLVPSYGVLGAGFASLLNGIFWNVAMSCVIWSKFKLRATAF